MTIFFIIVAIAVGLQCLRIFAQNKVDRASRIAAMDAHTAWLQERNPHCDSCAAKDGSEPMAPVIRCVKCCYCVSLWTGDPLFGFDHEKHKQK